jgi:hypothetical protein
MRKSSIKNDKEKKGFESGRVKNDARAQKTIT